MSKLKYNDASIERRQKDIEFLKSSIAKYDALTQLKDSPIWVPFKEMMENRIKTADNAMFTCLSAEGFENSDFSKAKKFATVKQEAKMYISAVEDAEAIKAEIRQQIKNLEAEIKEAQEQGA